MRTAQDIKVLRSWRTGDSCVLCGGTATIGVRVGCGTAGLCRACNSKCHGDPGKLVLLLTRRAAAGEQPATTTEVV